MPEQTVEELQAILRDLMRVVVERENLIRAILHAQPTPIVLK